MKPERWSAIEELFHSACSVPENQRDSYLHQACQGDESLRLEVESLLQHSAKRESVLEQSAIAIMAAALVADEVSSGVPVLEGKTISHYRIVERIGRGGMGVVYKAEDLRLGRYVAMKLLPHFLAEEPEARQRFEREARAASALNHPNICTVYEIDEADGLHFISIELLQGETLKSRMIRGPLPIKDILDIADDVCQALEAAHSNGIVHRDIKPANIFLTQSGGAKVLDFGVAKRVGLEREAVGSGISFAPTTYLDLHLTIPGAQLGTAAYMSPEQAAGQPVDARSDIFSLGAVLYEVTTGQLPFSATTPAGMIKAIQHGNPQSIEEVNPKIPRAWSRIIERAMQKEPHLRYQHAVEMQADLVALRDRMESKRNWPRAVPMTAFVAVLFLFAAATLLQAPHVRTRLFGKSSPSTQHASRLFVLPPKDTEFSLVNDNGGSVTLSADGTKIAFVVVDSDGKPRIWVRPLASLTSERVNGTEGATFPFWSADGRSLGFFADGKLKKVSLAVGSPVTLCDAEFGRGGSWNSQGTIIFAPTSHSGIYRVPDSGGTPTPVTVVDTSIYTTHRWPKFLPDGEHFIYLAASHFQEASHNGIRLGSLNGREDKFLVGSETDATYASGYLFFLDKDVLMAQPFDVADGQLHGEARPTGEKVLYDPTIKKAVFDASENGTMAYQFGDKPGGVNELRWFDRSGKQLAVLNGGFLLDSRLSRDGSKLALDFSNTGYGYFQLWVFDLARNVRAQVTFGKYDSISPIWSLDSSKVLFAGKRQYYSIYQVDSTGAEPEQLVLDAGSDIWPLDLSPDGHFLLYGKGVNIGRLRSQLWVYSLTRNAPPVRLLTGAAVESDGQFSPNGRWVAYTSNQSGQEDVYVVGFHAPSKSGQIEGVIPPEPVRVSVEGGREPRWRRDGRELYYLKDNLLMAVPVTMQNSGIAIGTPRPLFRANPIVSTYQHRYDVSPDGNKFIVCAPDPETTAPITLVENWMSDLAK
jgi:serine/threonine protein kinase